MDDSWFEASKFESLVTTKAESDFLVEAVVAAGIARVKFAEVGFGDTEEAGGAEDFFDDRKFDCGGGGFDADGVDEMEAEIYVVDLDVIVGLFEILHFLVGFPRIEWRDKNERNLKLLGDSSGVCGEYAEAAAAADAVLFVVDLHGPIAVGAFGGELVGEIFAFDSRVKFFDVFDVVEAMMSWLKLVVFHPDPLCVSQYIIYGNRNGMIALVIKNLMYFWVKCSFLVGMLRCEK